MYTHTTQTQTQTQTKTKTQTPLYIYLSLQQCTHTHTHLRRHAARRYVHDGKHPILLQLFNNSFVRGICALITPLVLGIRERHRAPGVDNNRRRDSIQNR